MSKKHSRNWMITSILLLCLCTLTACMHQQPAEEEINESFYKMSRTSSQLYETKEIGLKSMGIQRASGLLYFKDHIYLSDSSQSEIKVFNQQWNLVESIHSKKIVSPSLLAAYGDRLAILDKATSQIVLFDIPSKKEQSVITLPSIDSDSNYADMEMSKNDLLITYHTPAFEDANVLRIDLSTRKNKKIQEKFNGFVGTTNGKFYLVNSLVAFQESDREGFRSGKNSLWTLEDSKPKAIGNLIEGSAPGDFLWNGEILFQYTSGWSSIDRYDKSFNYMDSIAVFDQSDIQSLLKGNEQQMYLLMPNEQKLFEVHKK